MAVKLNQSWQDHDETDRPLPLPGSVPDEPVTPKADIRGRINLLPMMGRRDAAFDLAERLSCQEDFSRLPAAERGEAYRQIAELLRTVYEDCRQISMLLTSPDTKNRESRLFLRAVILKSFAAALADFFRRWTVVERDHETIQRFNINELEEKDTAPFHAMMAEVEAALLHQLRECFHQAHPGVSRYRTYAVKSFSAENGRRYHSSYSLYYTRKESLAQKFLAVPGSENSNPEGR